MTRSDGSGASYELTRWMDKESTRASGYAFCKAHGGTGACGPTEFYPGFAGLGAAQRLRPGGRLPGEPDGEGSIGYDEYAYALSNNIPVVKHAQQGRLLHAADGVQRRDRLQAAQIDEDPTSVDFLIQNLNNVYTNPDPRTYPLSSYSYLIVPRKSRVINGNTVGPPARFNTAKGDTLASYLAELRALRRAAEGRRSWATRRCR